jgi:hypothetical protein
VNTGLVISPSDPRSDAGVFLFHGLAFPEQCDLIFQCGAGLDQLK